MLSGNRKKTRFGTRIKQMLGISLGRFHLYDARPFGAESRPQTRPHRPGRLKFSIVTPSYNQGQYIGATVRSVLSQDYPFVEYIIQDSLSTDETKQVLANIDDQRLNVYFEKDAGQADAINRGFRRSNGDLMAYLNSDDLLLPQALSQIAAYFEINPHVDVVYANRIIVDERGAVIGHWLLPPHCSGVTRLVDYVPQETLFWRRDIWERIGGTVDASLQFAMDWDLILKFQTAGARIDHIPLFTGAFRVHQLQKTQAQIIAGRQEMARVRERYTSRILRGFLFPLHLLYLGKHMILNAKQLNL